jgi:hypothetical protein
MVVARSKAWRVSHMSGSIETVPAPRFNRVYGGVEPSYFQNYHAQAVSFVFLIWPM